MILSSIVIGKGPVLIILHGLFGEGRNWMGIAKELQSNFEIHLIDQRNHGNSFHDPKHHYLILADDLNNYIEQKNIKKFSIIGHSMGGKVAMSFSLLYPTNLDKLIIVDIAPKLYRDNYANIFFGLREVLLKSTSRKDAVLILNNHIDDIVITNFLLKGFFFDQNNGPSFKFNINSLELNIGRMLSFLVTSNTFNNLVYFILGSESDYVKNTDIRYISKLFPCHEIIQIPNAGHWVHFDQKEYFLSTINKILK